MFSDVPFHRKKPHGNKVAPLMESEDSKAREEHFPKKTIAAPCYLYHGDGGRLVQGNRIQDDEILESTEAMTRNDFEFFQATKVTTVVQLFVELVRKAILQWMDEQEGGFLSHKISPCVFTDDWIVRVTHFLEGMDQMDKQVVRLSLVDKQKNIFGLGVVECWMVLKLGSAVDSGKEAQKQGQQPLPLATFIKRPNSDNSHLQEKLWSLQGTIHVGLQEWVKHGLKHSIGPTKTPPLIDLPLNKEDLWGTRFVGKEKASIDSGNELTDALARLKSLKKAGATPEQVQQAKEEFKAHKLTKRRLPPQWQQNSPRRPNDESQMEVNQALLPISCGQKLNAGQDKDVEAAVLSHDVRDNATSGKSILILPEAFYPLHKLNAWLPGRSVAGRAKNDEETLSLLSKEKHTKDVYTTWWATVRRMLVLVAIVYFINEIMR